MHVRRGRVGDAAGIARVAVETWRATYRGIVADAFLDSLDVAERETRWAEALRRELPRIFVAEAEAGEVIGFAAGGPERRGTDFGGKQPDPGATTGELYAIYILPAHQRRGLGRRLVAAVARDLADRGFQGLVVWVLEENPARAFYEALGGRLAGRQPIRIGDQELIEVAYRWDRIPELLSRLAAF